MAIFVLMAWAMEFGVWTGFIKTEPQDNEGRAYRLAHDAFRWLREQLAEAELVEVSPNQLVYGPGLQRIVEHDGCLYHETDSVRAHGALSRERFAQPALDEPHPLGIGGRARFELSGRDLHVELLATDERDGPRAEHRLRATLRIRAPKGDGERAVRTPTR